MKKPYNFPGKNTSFKSQNNSDNSENAKFVPAFVPVSQEQKLPHGERAMRREKMRGENGRLSYFAARLQCSPVENYFKIISRENNFKR